MHSEIIGFFNPCLGCAFRKHTVDKKLILDNNTVRFIRKKINTICEESMWCSYHDEPVDWSKFEWKGCWGCQYFSGLDSKKYVYVSYAAEVLGVSEQTVRRWVKRGILEGTLYERGRSQFSPSAPKIYVIDRKSVDEVSKKRKSHKKASKNK